MVEIISLADDIPKWNILIHADSGAGKTVLAGSDDRVLFLAPEDSGTLSALRMGSAAQKIKVRHWDDIREAVEYLEANPDVLGQFDVLAVDSLTEMQKMCMMAILEANRGERLSKGQDPETPQIQDYGKLHVLFENLVRRINELNINVLYTALTRKVEDADHNEFLVPEISGKDYGVAMKIVALMTSYGHLRVELVEVPANDPENPERTKVVKRRTIYWEDTGTIRAKDRTTRLAPYTVNAKMKDIRLAIEGEMVRGANGKIVDPHAPKAPRKKMAAQASPKPEKPVESVEADNVESVEELLIEA
ncbi:MAG TPA: AAA family ATPase [Mesotoga prima]|uniref:AAA family ATPase n=1 Tax=Mesotoga prima TaxID=1184387 RepID=UPI002CD7532A|nr:AAA family ATPase [Mesotoga prima]HPE52991.1 AAA family ATPase [Mesotoga prima]